MAATSATPFFTASMHIAGEGNFIISLFGYLALIFFSLAGDTSSATAILRRESEVKHSPGLPANIVEEVMKGEVRRSSPSTPLPL